MLTNSTSPSTDQLINICMNSKQRHFISTGLMAAKTILLLPLSIFVLYLGHHQWCQQRSCKTMSHADILTYHLAVNELFWGIGVVGYFYGTYRDSEAVLIVGIFCFSVTFYGEVFFHLLTCVERYLAVVHPVTYLMSRNNRGVCIRNISIGCAWLLSVGLACFHTEVLSKKITIEMLCVLVFAIIIVTFCTVSVLCVLIRPGPGDNVRGRVDQAKLRALHTITAITSVLWLWFVGLFVCYALSTSSILSEDINCLIGVSVSFFNLPTSLVSPLLYLHRTGKLPSVRCNPD